MDRYWRVKNIHFWSLRRIDRLRLQAGISFGILFAYAGSGRWNVRIGREGSRMGLALSPKLPSVLAARLQSCPPSVSLSVETPQLSVVIVNFCQWKNTARLVRQLRKCEAIRRGAAEIVVVDNNSPRSRIGKRLGKLSGVTVLQSRQNDGFAKAVNKGCKFSFGEWVLLLNPDMTVTKGFLDHVLESAQRFPAFDAQSGIVGFQLRNNDGTRQASVGMFPTLFRTIAGLIMPRSRRKCQHYSTVQRQQVPWVTGGCFLIRRDCFEQLQGLDESYFLYYEDVDFCLRARKAGWTVWYDPSLKVTHHFPLHNRRVPAPMRLVTRHALLTYAQKHWKRWQAAVLGRIVWLESIIRGKLARMRNDIDSVEVFQQLRELVHDVRNGRDADAQLRLAYAIRYLDLISETHDGRCGQE